MTARTTHLCKRIEDVWLLLEVGQVKHLHRPTGQGGQMDSTKRADEPVAGHPGPSARL